LGHSYPVGCFTISRYQRALSICIGILGSVIFIGWILHDTSQILMRADQLGYNAHMGTFDLFMGIIGLFSFVHHLFNFIDD
jgi:FtsH-binding integral membrane protein